MIRVILELFRIMAIFLILGAVLGGLVGLIYASIGINVDYTSGGWLVGFAIIILLFVLYRNKLQFIGWYNGEGDENGDTITGGLLNWVQDGTYVLMMSSRVSKEAMLEIARSMK
ncbi:hypothetical protein CW357_11610 [Rummeliibacillus sp. TYF005]|uniref:hypothetical protein n=1 Tax=Rummeliibacillus sp. TYF005 TaxID=2058214 RepID=UPI000F53AC92|nr:hypothetical protein [Rummeliibacillus sp. TYF005]RPJ95251.1 hypothetical protein CW357_11610 [Rummeliibacillus sp. TYF005]